MNKSYYEINVYTENFHAFGCFSYDFDLCDWVLSNVSIESGTVSAGESAEDALFEQLESQIYSEIDRGDYL